MVMAARTGGVAIEIGIARAGLVASAVGWVEPVSVVAECDLEL